MPSLRTTEDYSRKLRDLTGLNFHFLRVLNRVPSSNKRTLWKCQCICGNVTVVRGDGLKAKTTVSCGCHHAQQLKLGIGKRHGMSGRKATHPVYAKWESMKTRCYSLTHVGYQNYGGRGIIVEEPWKSSFEAFSADMLPTWWPGASLERKNPNRNYCKGNCCWVDLPKQWNNTTKTVFASFDGRTQSVIEWAKEWNMRLPNAHYRLKNFRVPRPDTHK